MKSTKQESVISKEADPQEALADLPTGDDSELQPKGGCSSAAVNTYRGVTTVQDGTI